MSRLRESGTLYDARNRSETSLRLYSMLRRLAQLQKVAENDYFWYRVTSVWLRDSDEHPPWVDVRHHRDVRVDVRVDVRHPAL